MTLGGGNTLQTTDTSDSIECFDASETALTATMELDVYGECMKYLTFVFKGMFKGMCPFEMQLIIRLHVLVLVFEVANIRNIMIEVLDAGIAIASTEKWQHDPI